MSTAVIDTSFIQKIHKNCQENEDDNVSFADLSKMEAFFPSPALDRFGNTSNFSKDNKPISSNIPDPRYDPKNFQDKRDPRIKFAHGTTTLAFVFQGGVCVAVDSRATMGTYIGSGHVRKIIPINDYMLGTMAGGAADCQYWLRVLSQQCRTYELRNGEKISVAAASKLLANAMFQYRGHDLGVGSMICGYDKKGPQLYYVDNDGTRLKEMTFSCGSGSPYAFGILDSGYRFDMSRDEAIELGRKAIFHATHRDAASGGIVRVCIITEKGWESVFEEDMNVLYDIYEAKKNE